MRTRRRLTKGALTSSAVAFLVIIVILSGTFAAADAPWPQHPPGQDPYKYEDYCFSPVAPDDYGTADNDYWKYTSGKSDTPYQALISLFNPVLNRQELEGVMGASVDRAWSITTGRPDAVIAVLDSGIRWHDTAAMKELARKCYLNPGELPPPLGADTWDKNGDGVFNIDDYADDPRVSDLNGNGYIDPQDLIWRFSDGIDNDENGYVDDICGWDFLEDDNDPWDEVDCGHGTAGCVWSAGEANNGSGIPGTCPNAMILPVRVGDSFVVDANDFAQGVLFAVDSGAWVVQGAVSSLNNTPFCQAAIDYAYSRGVAVIASAADTGSVRQDFPANCERTIQVSAVQKYSGADSRLEEQFPPSYLYLGGATGYGAHNIASVPSDGHSSGAVGRLAGIAGLVYSAAENEVQRGGMWRYPGLDTPLSACEVKQIISMTADDIDFSPGSYGVSFGPLDAVIGPSERYPSTPGWDPYFGYGRVNAYEAVRAVAEGRIPPEAEITSPRRLEILGPGQVTLQVTGRVAAVRAEGFQYIVEWAPGWDPADEAWMPAGESGYMYEQASGVLATLDLGEVYRAVLDTMHERGGDSDPHRFAFTVRVRVRDNRGNWGEDRKTAFCSYDPDAYPGAPLHLGANISSPRFADLDNDGDNELIVATGEGLVYAYKADLSLVEGWPVHATPLPLHEGSEAFESGMVTGKAYASIVGTPAVGDLNRDGNLEVVAGDMAGRIYAWDREGRLLPGFPVASNPLYSIPDRADWWTEGALPAEWYDSRFVPDKVHKLDAWNRLQRGFLQGVALSNLDASMDGSLEIIAACQDQHVYAWHADGSPVAGWPVKLVDESKVASFDPVTHTVSFIDKDSVPAGGKIVTGPSVADLDGDGSLEVICGTNELYADEVINVSARTFDVAAFLSRLGAAGRLPYGPANTRVYALHHGGTLHGLEEGKKPAEDAVPARAYLEGWPVKVPVVVPGIFPNAAEGVSAPAAIADLDGDGRMVVAAASAAGPTLLFKPDGSSYLGYDELGLPLSLEGGAVGSGAGSEDLPVISAFGGGCFAYLGGSGLSYAAPTMGPGRIADMLLPARQVISDDQLSLWSGPELRMPADFPMKMDGMMLLASPGAADIDGDGMQEVLIADSCHGFRAVRADGSEPPGWPKFTGGRGSGTPGVGDLNGDGRREVALGTREGWLHIWKTSSTRDDAADWPECGHDPWGTGCLGTDASRPERVMDLKAEKLSDGARPGGIGLTWTAPAGGPAGGPALCYEIRFLDRPIDEGNWSEAVPLERGKPMPGEPGSREEFTYEGFPFGSAFKGKTIYFALQARDDAGNLSALSTPASVFYEE